MNRIALYIAAVVCLCGCSQYKMEEVLMVRDDVSLTIKGDPVFVYDADNCQVAYNSKRNEYRAMTDDMTQYFVLKASQTLSHMGQEFSADLTYKAAQK